VILHRCVPWDRSAELTAPGGQLRFARALQRCEGHDNADLFGCLSASQNDVGAVVEQLMRYRGGDRLTASSAVASARFRLNLRGTESRPAALRWWSTFESTFANVTVFDRAAPRLSSVATRELTTTDSSVLAAAELLGVATAAR
jgi:hypothetical protein